MGLANLADRVRALGGELTIDSAEGAARPSGPGPL